MKAGLVLILSCVAFMAEADIRIKKTTQPKPMPPGVITMRIAVEPEAMLPGIFPSLRIWITNSSTEPVEVPSLVALQVIPPRGEPFIAYAGLRGEERTLNLVSKDSVVVKPGETRDVSFWSPDDWFGTDPRFLAVGAFRLQVIADHNLDSLKLHGLTRVMEQSGLVQPLVSNETTFTVVEPRGADLAVWTVMKANGSTCTDEVTELIWREYPTSRYAAYCVRHSGDQLPDIAAYEAALAKEPHPIRAESYRLNIAHGWLNLAWKLTTSDVDASSDAYERARRLLEPIAREGLSPQHRRTAREYLHDVMTRDQVEEFYKIKHGWNDAPVRLHYTCYETLPDGNRKVWFGYTNPNRKPKEIAIGNDNKVTPPPFDRGQPTRFKPGTFDVAFHVITKEPVLVWHVQGKTTQFKISDAVACPKGFDPNDGETWTPEEEDDD